MRPQDGPDNAAAGPQLDPAQPAESAEPAESQPAQPVIHPEENGHVAGELAAVPVVGPPLPAELELRLAAMEGLLAEVTQRFTGESDRALARERVIDRQHEEIERLKSIERAGQLRPVVTDLCRLRNGLLRQAGTVPTEMTGPQVAALLESFAATVAEALERCGVVALPRQVGAPFIPTQQQVAAVVEIDDPDQDGTVAEVVQDGYLDIDAGKVVVPARIRLHRYVTKEKADG